MKNLLIVLLTAAMFGCKKEKVPVPEEKALSLQIAEMQYSLNGQTPEVTNITYDAQGRISAYTKGDKKYLFNYKTPTTLQVNRYKISDNTLTQTINCILNAAGAIITEEYRDVPNNAVIYTYQYSYNIDGYLVLVEGFSSSSTHQVEFLYSNGQLMQAKYYNDNVYKSIAHFKYDTSIADKTNLPYWWNWPSSTLFGKPQQYALVETKEFDMANKPVQHWTNSFLYDATAKVLTETRQSQLNNNVQQLRYRFQ
ncbi:DUF4595 domain-containing protein [Niabella sp. CC-SYL272]|uniref:DUF4595 domain-containing protein n=1 Tax=Niabella agricola TaxID=2891571 RepID=UPI001F3AC4B2|nr:DUF4595 domain-containing protein [Niabella agricola]MCF3109754.1 DUF4595 domain-containing protein [Niabella agricola]